MTKNLGPRDKEPSSRRRPGPNCTGYLPGPGRKHWGQAPAGTQCSLLAQTTANYASRQTKAILNCL